MKRTLFFVGCLMIAGSVSAQTKKQTMATTISKVTVFIKGAQITRTGSIALAAGVNQIVISEVSPDVEEKSIQVNGDGDFTLLAVSRQSNMLRQQNKREEIATLQQQREKLQLQLAKENNNEQVYTEEKNMLLKNQTVTGNNGVKAADLQASLDLQRTRLSEILSKILDIQQAAKQTSIELKKVEQQLMALNNQDNIPTSDIILDIQSKIATTGKITVSYMVRNAGWIPSYDIRVKDINHPINLVYKANVFQQCGEDWKNVKLSLSSGSPEESSTKPTLLPWYLRSYNSVYERNADINGLAQTVAPTEITGIVTDEDNTPLPGATISIKGRTLGAITDGQGKFRIQQPPGNNIIQVKSIGYMPAELPARNNLHFSLRPDNKALGEVVVTGYYADSNLEGRLAGLSVSSNSRADKKIIKIRGMSTLQDVPEVFTPTTVNFDIPVPYTILPDGKPYSVGIKELEIPASYQYFAIPKLEKAAYLTASVTEWEQLNLLDGEASIFYEGTYIGKTLLDLQSGADSLQISLGKDKQVVVNRTMQKDESKKGFLGGKTTFSKSWEISVRNNKGIPVNVIVQDQLPIKTSSEMEVSRVEYGDAVLQEDTRQLNWHLNIPPATEQKRVLKYAITYPKGMITNAQ
ncbi:uncharacterized protein (TIGR02231 family) [Chitinophaga dinghuensis]|uniref:Uncharacterized protein (TIGR02231 family) n=1 Tax=Chitinophaga dinghuensis TaxID=1539050 RepID=A0A327W3L3_9BACT|nr:DUF4139 domain-containing protein [Chitinophaga dinghuensis]RAJ83253.1 uncharacterized protein (TIGR02231 family) [Chitinophaga dinghuensis]